MIIQVCHLHEDSKAYVRSHQVTTFANKRRHNAPEEANAELLIVDNACV